MASPAPADLLVVDDHAAVRAGVVALLEDEDRLSLLPAVAGAKAALRAARRRRPQVALVDVSLEDGDGLRLCLDLKRLSAPPRVVLYTASADPLLEVKARLAGADALLPKSARASELIRAIDAALRGEPRMPAFDYDLLRAHTKHLAPEAMAIVGMRLNSTPISGIGVVLGLTENEVVTRIAGLLEILDARL